MHIPLFVSMPHMFQATHLTKYFLFVAQLCFQIVVLFVYTYLAIGLAPLDRQH